MDKIDWKRKLTSRKFWALLAGLVSGILVFAWSPERSPEAVGGILLMFGSIISYIFGEAIADSGEHNTILTGDYTFEDFMKEDKE